MSRPTCSLRTRGLVLELRARKIVDAKNGYMRGPYPQELKAAERIEALEQALWDIYGILGFDQDGAQTPAPLDGEIITLVKEAAQEFRTEYDNAIKEM